uniref:hypothetical protein n=1 Tax=Fulvivirga sp. TaxID=1931237 RepID=UPI004049B707
MSLSNLKDLFKKKKYEDVFSYWHSLNKEHESLLKDIDALQIMAITSEILGDAKSAIIFSNKCLTLLSDSSEDENSNGIRKMLFTIKARALLSQDKFLEGFKIIKRRSLDQKNFPKYSFSHLEEVIFIRIGNQMLILYFVLTAGLLLASRQFSSQIAIMFDSILLILGLVLLLLKKRVSSFILKKLLI